MGNYHHNKMRHHHDIMWSRQRVSLRALLLHRLHAISRGGRDPQWCMACVSRWILGHRCGALLSPSVIKRGRWWLVGRVRGQHSLSSRSHLSHVVTCDLRSRKARPRLSNFGQVRESLMMGACQGLINSISRRVASRLCTDILPPPVWPTSVSAFTYIIAYTKRWTEFGRLRVLGRSMDGLTPHHNGHIGTVCYIRAQMLLRGRSTNSSTGGSGQEFFKGGGGR